jgi:hypothetical protein
MQWLCQFLLAGLQPFAGAAWRRSGWAGYGRIADPKGGAGTLRCPIVIRAGASTDALRQVVSAGRLFDPPRRPRAGEIPPRRWRKSAKIHLARIRFF